MAGALAVHVAWGVARLPGKVIARRAEHVRAFERDGATRALFDANGLAGADAIDWLLAHTAPDAVVAWAGDETGAMEFAPALLWPRLVVAAEALGAGERWCGRAIARGRLGGRDGTFVLVGAGRELRLEVR